MKISIIEQIETSIRLCLNMAKAIIIVLLLEWKGLDYSY